MGEGGAGAARHGDDAQDDGRGDALSRWHDLRRADDGEIWFKADAESAAIWDEAGCERFIFTAKDGRTETMNYRRAPSDVYDDAEEMQRWARLAVEAGLRGAAKKRPKKAQRP